ncbi:hypothetical protein L484_018679 [Morus notabilis]|uniref:Uncharacterized protein n=1 Tax=Morus notabilis TaxID=981085 RepID=W9RZ43_9ROSA|nr:hypothetical protein L484_018679 [Morus notabilis]
MGCFEGKKTNQYDLVLLSDEHTITSDMPSYISASKYEKDKRNKIGSSLWFYRKNVEIKDKKDEEKAVEFFENKKGVVWSVIFRSTSQNGYT